MKAGKVLSNSFCRPCLITAFDFYCLSFRHKKGQLSLAFFLLLLCCTAYCFYNSDRFSSVFIAQLRGLCLLTCMKRIVPHL